MAHLIDKDALVAEIARQKAQWRICKSSEAKYRQEMLDDISSFLDSLEVKEVDLEKYYHDFLQKEWFGNSHVRTVSEMMAFTAKHFFELGLSASNPITATDRGTAEEIIVNLKRVEQDYHINLTREMEWLRNKVKKG